MILPNCPVSSKWSSSGLPVPTHNVGYFRTHWAGPAGEHLCQSNEESDGGVWEMEPLSPSKATAKPFGLRLAVQFTVNASEDGINGACQGLSVQRVTGTPKPKAPDATQISTQTTRGRGMCGGIWMFTFLIASS